MSDTTSTDKTLRVGGRKPLSLKRDTDTVRQSFSGGRSKSVVVEKKRTRVAGPAKRPEIHAPGEDASSSTESARPRVRCAGRNPRRRRNRKLQLSRSPVREPGGLCSVH